MAGRSLFMMMFTGATRSGLPLPATPWRRPVELAVDQQGPLHHIARIGEKVTKCSNLSAAAAISLAAGALAIASTPAAAQRNRPAVADSQTGSSIAAFYRSRGG